ncbi:MAG: hypothetical protein O6757_12575 [Alphaproteobacteria bacterium]|nr:hypothetical protein [Alphaproteobacteria bacterium]
MPAEFSVLPTRHPINPAVDAAFSVPATGQNPHDGASPPALGGSPAEHEDAPFSLWGSDGLTFGDVFDIINPLQHIPIVSTIYRSITGDDIAAAPKVAGGALFGGVIGLVVSIIDTVIEQITGQDTGEHILALFKGADTSGEVLVADEDDGFAPHPVEVGEAEFTGGTEDVSGLAQTPGEVAGASEVSEMIIEMDQETTDALIFAAAPVTPVNGNHAPVEIRRLARSGAGGQAIASANADAASGEIEPSRGRTVVRGAMTAAKAASLDDIGANSKAPPSPPRATTPGPAPASASAKVNTPAKGIPDRALELLATMARAGVPLNDPRAAAIPGLLKAMPGAAAAGQSPFAVANRALWLESITDSGGKDADKRKDGNRPSPDRGVVQAMGRALDQYNRSSRLGAAGPRVTVDF